MIKQVMIRHLAVLFATVMLTGNLAAPALAAEVSDEYSAQAAQEEQIDNLDIDDTSVNPGPEDGDSLSLDLEEESAPEETADGADTSAPEEAATTAETSVPEEAATTAETSAPEEAADAADTSAPEEIADAADTSASEETADAADTIETETSADPAKLAAAETEETVSEEETVEPELAPGELVKESVNIETPQSLMKVDTVSTAVTVTKVSLDAQSAVLYEKKTRELTLTAELSGSDENSLRNAAGQIEWKTGNGNCATVAPIGSGPAVTMVTQQVTAAGDTGSVAKVTGCVVTQKALVTAVKEGKTSISAKIQGAADVVCNVEVKPVPAALAKSTNLYWKNTTVLCWGAVKNTNIYEIVIGFASGSKKASSTVTVTGKTSCDLEDQINALVKANKSSIKGASCTISATVRAIAKDTVHYKNGPAVKAPSFRYLMSTYKEAVSRNGWFQKAGKWYFYEAGKKQTGWLTFRGKKYYLDQKGIMQTNCWIGQKYVKASGEMAVDEWVDHYQFYVNAKGLKVENASFSTKNWVKTSKGWRYKKKDGTYLKNTWRTINHRKYYFDKNGYMRTGWLTVKGKKYFMNNTGDVESGRGDRQTGWVKVGSYYYWFDDKGVMAVNQWVDKGQYYVNKAGHRLSWITYANLRNVNTSNRLGYYVYDWSTPPEQSIAGYDLAYKKGNRILVADLRFTKDNVPVCFHDDLVKYAYYKDGGKPGERPSVSGLTLKELQEYDFGIRWGEQYKGTAPLTLEEMAKWVKKHTDAEVYIEVKTDKMNAAQIKKTVSILNKYKIVDRSSVIFAVTSASDTRAQRMHKQAPRLRIGITAGSVGSMAINQAKKSKGTDNEVFLWCWNHTKLSASAVKKLRALSITFECGTFANLETLDEIIGYYSKGSAYAYTSGVETPGEVFHKALQEATFHAKAKWESTDDGWKYKQIDGTYVRSKWLTLGTKKYHFDKNGIMQTGWLTLGGKLYYLNAKGEMVTGTRTIAKKKYLFDENGVMVKRVS